MKFEFAPSDDPQTLRVEMESSTSAMSTRLKHREVQKLFTPSRKILLQKFTNVQRPSVTKKLLILVEYTVGE